MMASEPQSHVPENHWRHDDCDNLGPRSIVVGLTIFATSGCMIFRPIVDTEATKTRMFMEVVAEDILYVEKECSIKIDPPSLAKLWTEECAKAVRRNGSLLAERYPPKTELTDQWGHSIFFAKDGSGRFLESFGEDGKAGGQGLNQDIVVGVDAHKR